MSLNVAQRDAIYRTLEATTKIVEDHVIVTLNAAGEAVLANGVITPYASTTKTTKSKRDAAIGKDVFLTGAEQPGAIKLTRSGLVNLSLALDHDVIVIGDKLAVKVSSADGTVEKAADAWGTNDELGVAVAEEAVAVPAGGQRTQATIQAYLNFNRYGGM